MEMTSRTTYSFSANSLCLCFTLATEVVDIIRDIIHL